MGLCVLHAPGEGGARRAQVHGLEGSREVRPVRAAPELAEDGARNVGREEVLAPVPHLEEPVLGVLGQRGGGLAAVVALLDGGQELQGLEYAARAPNLHGGALHARRLRVLLRAAQALGRAAGLPAPPLPESRVPARGLALAPM